MPNWCNCELYITGNRKDIATFKKFAKSKKTSDGECVVLDMEQFVPYPQKFIDMDNEAAAHKKQYPNGCQCHKNGFMSDGYNSGGHEWCIANWGTKWNFSESTIVKESCRSLLYQFMTAWSPPCPIILAMSKKFPELTFKLQYDEPGNGFSGEYECKNGEVVIDSYDDTHDGDRGG